MLNEEPEPGASVCAASNSVLHTWPEELHVTVKTTVSHHASRLPHLARTWMQSLHPHQVVMRVPRPGAIAFWGEPERGGGEPELAFK